MKHVHNLVPRALFPGGESALGTRFGLKQTNLRENQISLTFRFNFRSQKFSIFQPWSPSYLFLLLQMRTFGLLGYFLDQ